MTRQSNSIDESVLDMMLNDAALQQFGPGLLDKNKIKKILEHNIIYDMNLTEPSYTPLPGELSLSPITLETDEEGLTAWICLCPSGTEEQEFTQEALKEALEKAGIVLGVNQKVLARMSRNPVWGRPFVVAKGLPPKEGRPAHIRYCFDAEKEVMPLDGYNDHLDFTDFDFLQNVKEGDLLCEIIPASGGSDGLNIFGLPVSADGSQELQLLSGKNTRLSEDKQRLYAACDGEVSLCRGAVTVERVLRLKNVDATTGNVRYIGSIYIENRITEGFTVKATNHVLVGDVIEDATVSAGGNIIVRRGIKGGSRGSITAEGNIQAYYIENGTISAQGNVYADAIMRSDIQCRGKVILRLPKGSLVGGNCRAREIHGASFGNKAGIPTGLEIISNDSLKEELRSCQEKAAELESILAKMQTIMDASHAAQKQIFMKSYIQYVYQKNENQHQMTALAEEIQLLENAYDYRILASEAVYANVHIKYQNATHTITAAKGPCTFFMAGNGIQMGSYY